MSDEDGGWLPVLSAGIGLLPVIGNAKGLIELVTGNDSITGEELSPAERFSGAIPFLGPAMRGVDFAITATRVSDAVTAAEKANEIARGLDSAKAGEQLHRALDKLDTVVDVGQFIKAAYEASDRPPEDSKDPAEVNGGQHVDAAEMFNMEEDASRDRVNLEEDATRDTFHMEQDIGAQPTMARDVSPNAAADSDHESREPDHTGADSSRSDNEPAGAGAGSSGPAGDEPAGAGSFGPAGDEPAGAGAGSFGPAGDEPAGAGAGSFGPAGDQPGDEVDGAISQDE